MAYYPEVIKANVKAVKHTRFIYDFVGIHNRREFPKKFTKILNHYMSCKFTVKQVKRAADLAYQEYESYMRKVRVQTKHFLEEAEKQHRPVIVIAGRPYHMDPEINHGLDNFICELGAVVVSEDGLSNSTEKFRTTVLNQWTYHARLYSAAKYVAEMGKNKNINLIQFISFGCGVPAMKPELFWKKLEKFIHS